MKMETLKRYFNQKTFAIISVVGLLAVLVIYVFVYLNMQTKTEELEAENDTKRALVAQLEEYYNNMAVYEADIATMQEEIAEVMSRYPADAREEDILMLAVETQTDNAIGFDSINMEASEVVYEISADTVASAGIEGYSDAIRFVKKHAAYVNTTTYNDLKNVIGEIFASSNRIGIDSIVYTKNEENGCLEGSIDLYFYSASGTGREYAAPEIKAYPAGTSDIFQTGKTVSKATSGDDTVEAQDTEAQDTETAQTE